MTYQPRLFKNKTSSQGRECLERWDLFKEHIPDQGVIFDIGSSAGFFGVKTILEKARTRVLSMEASADEASMQRLILASHQTDRICLINGMISGQMTERWSQMDDVLDLTLILSVIHWFDKPALVLRSLCRVSKKVIVEMLDKNDAGACGQAFIRDIDDPLEWVREVTGMKAHLIARTTRHTSEHKSHLILIENNSIQGDRPARLDVSNLMSLGKLMWPPRQHWLHAVNEVRGCSVTPLQLFQHNVAWTGDGVVIEGDHTQKLVWQVGGSRSLEEDEAQRMNQVHKHYELKFFERCLIAWENNETALSMCAVERLFPFRAFICRWKRSLKNCFKLLIPESLYEKLRKVFTGS
jgi:SAM-dependent methyltransferase